MFTLFLSRYLHFSTNTSVVIFAAINVAAIPFLFIGAIVSDCFIDNYITVTFALAVKLVGDGLILLSAIPPLNAALPLAVTGVVLTLFAGIAGPSLLAFIGNQWTLPAQQHQMVTFYSAQYVLTNVGAITGKWISPNLRQDYRCFGQPECYALTIGVGFLILCVAFGLYFEFLHLI